MNTRKITSIIASASIMFQMAAPAVLASTTLEISGNGADSANLVDIARQTETNVVQSNNANIENDIKVDADTGDNEANKNTGGNVHVETGDADVAVSVQNAVNENSVDLDSCDCDGDVDVMISENGADSENLAEITTSNQTLVVQENAADIENKIDAEGKTGDNETNKNTGGDITVDTGDSTITIGVATEANANSASIGGGSHAGSMLSARIMGNGADSLNAMDLDLDRALDVVQSNVADVENRVKAEAETGDNEADENTGGIVMIETGDADVLVGIDNMVNFNVADVDCDCFLEDVSAKIAGNGTDAESLIAAELGDSLGVFQDNCGAQSQVGSFDRRDRDGDCEVENKVDAEAETGDNDAEESTGDYTGDPSIETGDADATVILENSGHVNTVGSDSSNIGDQDNDSYGNGIDLDFTIDLSELLAFLGL